MKFESKFNHGDDVRHTVSGQKGIVTSLSVNSKKAISYQVSSGIGSSAWVDEEEIEINNSKSIGIETKE